MPQFQLQNLLRLNIEENINIILQELQEFEKSHNYSDSLYVFLSDKILSEAKCILEGMQSLISVPSEEIDQAYQIKVLAAVLLLSHCKSIPSTQARGYWQALIYLLSYSTDTENKHRLINKMLELLSSNSTIVPSFTWDSIITEKYDDIIEDIISMSIPINKNHSDSLQAIGVVQSQNATLSILPFYEGKKTKTTQPICTSTANIKLYAPKSKLKYSSLDTIYDQLVNLYRQLQSISEARLMVCDDTEVNVKIISATEDGIYVAVCSDNYMPIEGKLHLFLPNTQAGYTISDCLPYLQPGMIIEDVLYCDGAFHCTMDSYLEEVAEDSESAIVVEKLPITNTWKVLTETGVYMAARSANELQIGNTCKIKNIKPAKGQEEAYAMFKCKVEDILSEEAQLDIELIKGNAIKDFIRSSAYASITGFELQCLAHAILDYQGYLSDLEERAQWLICAGSIFAILESKSEFDLVCVWLKYTQLLQHFSYGELESIVALEDAIDVVLEHPIYEQLNILLKVLHGINKQVNPQYISHLSTEAHPIIRRIAVAVSTYKINQEQGLPSISSELAFLQQKIARELHIELKNKVSSSEYGLESDRVEFKSSIVVPAGTMKPDESKQMAVIFKSVCGMLNTTTGGTLYIGVDNEGYAIKTPDMGIQGDLEYLNNKYGHKYKNAEDYCRYLQQKIESHFQSYVGVANHLTYSLRSNNLVLAIEIRPYQFRLVESYGNVYERRNTSTHKIEDDELKMLKYTRRLNNHLLIQNVKILKQAILLQKTVILRDYLSGNSNTIQDRHLEVFKISDDYQFIWAYDLDKDQKVKLFKVQRIHKLIEITDQDWQYADLHIAQDIDVFNMGGTTSIQVHLELDNLAKTLLQEEYPRSIDTLEFVPSTKHEGWWSVDINVYHLKGVARFCMGLVGHVVVADSPELEEHLNEIYKSGQEMTSVSEQQQEHNANMSIADRLSSLVRGITLGLAAILPTTMGNP